MSFLNSNYPHRFPTQKPSWTNVAIRQMSEWLPQYQLPKPFRISTKPSRKVLDFSFLLLMTIWCLSHLRQQEVTDRDSSSYFSYRLVARAAVEPKAASEAHREPCAALLALVLAHVGQPRPAPVWPQPNNLRQTCRRLAMSDAATVSAVSVSFILE